MSDEKKPLHPAVENLIDMIAEAVLDEIETEQEQKSEPKTEGGAK